MAFSEGTKKPRSFLLERVVRAITTFLATFAIFSSLANELFSRLCRTFTGLGALFVCYFWLFTIVPLFAPGRIVKSDLDYLHSGMEGDQPLRCYGHLEAHPSKALSLAYQPALVIP